MCAVFAGDVAKIAADAVFFIDVSLYVVIEIEISPIGHAVDRFADDVVDRSKTFLVEIIIQPVDHVLDDAVAVMHHGSADLNISGAEQHKLNRVAPSVDAADAADRNIEFRIAGKLARPC